MKKKENNPKRKPGRPKKPLDYKIVENLASMFSTQDEIASILGVSVRTLQRDPEFCRLYRRGLDKGKVSLRRTQFNLAEKNAQMAIFLGKQYLNQSDKIESKQEVSLSIEDYLKNNPMDL